MVFVFGFKRQFIVPISLGLGIPYALDDVVDIDAKPKRQTIRADGKRRRPRVGEHLRFYTSMRTKFCRRIGDARCTRVRDVTIQFDRAGGRPSICVQLDGNSELNGNGFLSLRGLHAFSQRDGFRDAEAMAEFWLREHKNKHGKFTGYLTEWEPITEEASQTEGALQCSPSPKRKKLVAA